VRPFRYGEERAAGKRRTFRAGCQVGGFVRPECKKPEELGRFWGVGRGNVIGISKRAPEKKLKEKKQR